MYVGNQPTGYVDPDGRIGLPGFLKDGIGVLGRGVNAFGRAFTRSNQPGFYAPISGGPAVTDNFPPFLGSSITGDDDGGGFLHFRVYSNAPALVTGANAYQSNLELQNAAFGATVDRKHLHREAARIFNFGLVAFGAFSGLANDFLGNKIVLQHKTLATRWLDYGYLGRLFKRNNVRIPFRIDFAATSQLGSVFKSFGRLAGGIGLTISAYEIGSHVFTQNYRQAIIAGSGFVGGVVGGTFGALLGSGAAPGVGTVVGGALGASAGDYAGRKIAMLLLEL